MNTLKHYGVLGMKWGIRRYQDKNGNYTAEGKKRYIEDKTAGLRKAKSRFEEKGKTRHANQTSRKIERLTRRLSKKFDIEDVYTKLNMSHKMKNIPFNSMVRKKIAKLVANNNMSISEAKRKYEDWIDNQNARAMALTGRQALNKTILFYGD